MITPTANHIAAVLAAYKAINLLAHPATVEGWQAIQRALEWSLRPSPTTAEAAERAATAAEVKWEDVRKGDFIGIGSRQLGADLHALRAAMEVALAAAAASEEAGMVHALSAAFEVRQAIASLDGDARRFHMEIDNLFTWRSTICCRPSTRMRATQHHETQTRIEEIR